MGGYIRSAVVGRPLGGHGADLIILDDPLTPSRALDETALAKTNTWYDQEVSQRLNNSVDGALVLVMQRVATGDLTAHLANSGTFEQIELPSVTPRDQEWTLSSGERLTRKARQVLDPQRDSLEAQFKLLQQVGAYAYATQYLQNSCGSVDGIARAMHSPRPDNWTPETCNARTVFIKPTFLNRILIDIFGYEDEYAGWTDEYPYTPEEWEASAVIQQRRLVESAQSDMR